MFEAIKNTYVDYLLRILLAMVLGFCIGFERKCRSKEAGIRTHTIVAVGAALFMIVSKYGFDDSVSADRARVAAQIVGSVGFLGAGMIMHQREIIRGLTTAAGIWATAAVGMAAAAGLWQVAIGVTVLLIGIQLIFHANVKFFQVKHFNTVKIRFIDEDNAKEALYSIFNVKKFSSIKMDRVDGRRISVATIKYEKEISDSDLSRIMEENQFIVSCENYIEDSE